MYKYSVYYLPLSKWLKIQDHPGVNKRDMDERDMDNQTQLNNINNKIDKEDKFNHL